MATLTYSPLATLEISGTTDTITFDNIPATDVNGNDLHHLVLIWNLKADTNGTTITIKLNTTTSTIYNYTSYDFRANSTTANSNTTYFEAGKINSGYVCGGELQILGSHLSESKSFLSISSTNENANATEFIATGNYRDNAAVTKVVVGSSVGDFTAGTISLFGVV